MGEKIRDLHTITIGDKTFMIELNEGYSPSQGRLIHIQNSKFRYLLTEKDFYHLSSVVMRGWSEFEYEKNKRNIASNILQNEPREIAQSTVLNENSQLESQFMELGIRYRILDIQKKMITFIIHPKDRQNALSNLVKNGWENIIHPYGVEAGYKFLYQMDPFMLYKKEDVFLEVYSQLPCASLTKNTWIPLDREIQSFLWENESGSTNRWCNTPCKLLYHLCWSIFLNKAFSEYTRQYIKEHADCLQIQIVKELFEKVFFRFTDRIIYLIIHDRFDQIIPEYLSFTDY